MIISLNWVKKYTDINMPIGDLVTLIGARLVEIEDVIDLSEKYKDVLVVKVVDCEKLGGSDHLSLTKIDDGGKVKNVDRDEKGLVQVVCGAPNIAAGQFVAWLPPESTVPATFGKPEPFVLAKKELRGIISNGMIASAKELDLFDEHEGILVLDNDQVAGASFADQYELDDYLLDIENKSLTHRPDCFGIIGFAREIAAITGGAFKTPDWLLDLKPDFEKVQADEMKFTVSIDDSELSSRYQAIVMADADGSKKSPLQIQTYLSRVGIRPISAVVDVTNYLMILTGQPLHAFDYDKLVAVGGGEADIHVRAAREKEKLELLDGRNIELTTDDIVISAGDTAIGLAGAMGGANTEIDGNTKNIIVEAASFNLYNLRATQMRHGIFSEAITRFTKGLPAGLTAPVLFDAVRLMSEWSNARAVSKVADTYPELQETVSIDTYVNLVNDILGSTFSVDVFTNVLNNVEFIVQENDDGKLSVTVPYWRADIHIIEDISEEVGRLSGFDNIKPTLPVREFVATRPGDFDTFRSKVRKLLARAGANETLTYSFIHGKLMQKAGLEKDNSYQIVNSISPDLQYYRQTLTPSLLDLVHPNVKQKYDNFGLFEINKVQAKSDGVTNEEVPIETDSLAFVISKSSDVAGAAYYHAKRVFDYVSESLGIDVVYQKNDSDSVRPVDKPFEYRRSASLINSNGGKRLGVLGEYRNSVSTNFKLPDNIAGFEVDIRELFEAMSGKDYSPISRFPSAERDVCFKVQQYVEYAELVASVKKSLTSVKLEVSISPVDIYKPNDADTKNITIRLKLVSHERTLTGEEVAEVVNAISKSVVEQTGAEVV